MLKLIALLCAAMFGVLLIAGEDRGQLRPGLANAPFVPEAIGVKANEAPPVVLAAAISSVTETAPADVAPVSEPLTVDAGTTPATDLSIQETVFSLANYSDEAPVSEVATVPETAGDLAYVAAASVNVREGPGTGNPVITRLTRGEAVMIVSTDDTGWARIRIEGDGLEGFMSLEYLSASAP